MGVTTDGPAHNALEPGIAALRRRLQGELIGPADPAYETARRVWNGAFDRRPALVVRCADAIDVTAAVSFAAQQRLPIAVRSGGHSLAGHGTCDGGLVLDLSLMRGLDVDPAGRRARVEPGLTWGEVAAALQPYGLGISASDTASVGVGGVALGGGIGWMVRAYGLAIDQLRAVDLVTADGRHRRASASDHADLFWGLRGGGGNFGVATAFEFDLHPMGTILGGVVLYDAADAMAVLRAYTSIAAAAPDALSTQLRLTAAWSASYIPADWQGRPVVAVLVCYVGDWREGERVVAPLRRLAPPIADYIGPMPATDLFELTAADDVSGLARYEHSTFVDEVDGALLRTLVNEAAAMTPEMAIEVRVLGGAMSRVPAAATAFAHRTSPLLVTVTSAGPNGTTAATQRQARTDRVWQALRPWAAGTYVNLLAADEAHRIGAAYPPATYARLAALKAHYDPTNLFCHNHNITVEPVQRAGRPGMAAG